MQSVFITGADRGVGLSLCDVFAGAGWRVLAGQFIPDWPDLSALAARHPDRLTILPLDVGDTTSVVEAAAATARLLAGQPLDMLVSNAGIARGALRDILGVNAIAALRLVDHLLPLMEGGLRRLCFVSSEAGSITLQHRDGGSDYCVSKAALNMAVRLLFEQLQPQGYTFRLYHPGWVRSYMMGHKNEQGNFEPEEAAAAGYAHFCADKAAEDVLALTDICDMDWPF